MVTGLWKLVFSLIGTGGSRSGASYVELVLWESFLYFCINLYKNAVRPVLVTVITPRLSKSCMNFRPTIFSRPEYFR